ncbi:MAG TPA: DUF1365 domain-containing protein [Solimonas sp.]|nr:DUF1365 domain-containing protein [Solimonas sp.]
MNTDQAGWLYPARVMHRRRIAPLYRFVYRLFYLLVDIDRLGELHRRYRFFSHNRYNLLSLRDRDYGDGRSLRTWAESLLVAQGVVLDGGRIRLLTLPRVLGWAFNPISLWYCEHRDGSLRAVIVEVRNTFGEKHCYVLASGGAPLPYDALIEKDKCFHVSPFLDRAGRYGFQLSAPEARLRVAIHESRDGVPVMDATLAAERRPLSDAALLAQVLRMPWMAAKVVAGIHWEALKLWLRGAGYRPKPVQLPQDLS